MPFVPLDCLSFSGFTWTCKLLPSIHTETSTWPSKTTNLKKRLKIMNFEIQMTH
jgi:hypothetical protein